MEVKRRNTAYLIAGFILIFSLWITLNAMRQIRQVVPGETPAQAVRALLIGRPILGRNNCPPSVHDLYQAQGPDGMLYPTWHPPYDIGHGCYFDHEHGSDPHSYVGFADSGMPPFGYASSQAGFEESHAGYKVFVTNDDLNGRAWMIVLNQDTGRPERAEIRYYSLDWHISTLNGDPLVQIRVMADFGNSTPNCSGEILTPAEGASSQSFRSVPTVDCAPSRTYEYWSTRIDVAGVFKASPVFEIDNPQTAIDPDDFSTVIPICVYRSGGEACVGDRNPWVGNRRGILRPGQNVDNPGMEFFFTDPFGQPVTADEPGAILQYVTQNGWNTRNCCGPEVVFRIQTFSGGVYIAAPKEPAGSVEFSVGWP
jgi:hypothetical protein